MTLATPPNRPQPFPMQPPATAPYKFSLRVKALGVLAVALLTTILVAPHVLASAGDEATAKAISIAAAIIVIAPLVLPFILKLLPVAGQWMTAIAYGVSLIVAVAAAVLSGLVHATDFSTAPGVLAASLAIYGLMQLVYNIFKQHATFSKFVI